MTSTFPELRPRDGVLRGERAGTVAAARFDVDLRGRPELPTEVSAQLRAEAHAAGYAVGWAQGRQEAEVAARAAQDQFVADTRQLAAEQAARVDRALAAIAVAAGGLERRTGATATDVEDAIVATAFGLAQAIVGRELALAASPGRDALARALALAPVNRPVRVRLNPADHAVVSGGDAGTAVGAVAGAGNVVIAGAGASSVVEVAGREVTLVADPTLQPGDAVAECDATTIDARLAPALDRVKEVLGL